MKEEIEIEFKCTLSQEQFRALVGAFKPGPFLTQHNHYFDTAFFHLKNAGAALRIREKNDHAEMTLKEPADEGLRESTVPLSQEEAAAFLQHNAPDNAVIKRARKRANTTEPFRHFGTLTTSRAEMPYEGGLLVFDHSTYLGKEDFEIEFEAADPSGEAAFSELLASHGISYTPAPNKIRRFYDALQNEKGE